MALVRQTRQEWGAEPPKYRRYISAAVAATGGVAGHYPGSSGSLRHTPHSLHEQLLREWQQQHKARGSNDLEYGSVICPCLIWMEGRTEFDNWLVRVGSNGTTRSNDNFTSVQLMLGVDDVITDAEKAAFAEVTFTLREHGWGRALLGHRDFVGTACPGDSLYNALPEIRRMADRWKDFEMALTDADVDRIAEAVAARVNRALGDFNAKGEPNRGVDKPEFAAAKIRQTERKVDAALKALGVDFQG